jgi:orotate phosphoribosyltransferase
MSDPESVRKGIIAFLARHAYQFKPGGFKLVSGQISDEYLDCKRALTQAHMLPLVGEAIEGRLVAGVEAVGGLTMGADPLAIATSYASTVRANPIRWFAVRKAPKDHGSNQLIEGALRAGDGVAVLDDVATTGGSTIDAIRKVRAHGARVLQVIVLVDREQGGLDAIRAALGDGVPVSAITTKSEVRAMWGTTTQRLDPSMVG